MRIVFDCPTQGTFPRDPKPIHNGDIDRPAVERDFTAFKRSKFLDAEVKAFLAGKPVTCDDIKLPSEWSGLLNAYTQVFRTRRFGSLSKPKA